MGESVLFSVFLIFTGAALLATVALFARQSLLIAYIAVGVIAGPSVTGLIADPHLISELAHIGIIFLLFLLGLDLSPRKLLEQIREAVGVTLISSIIFALLGYGVGLAAGLSRVDCLVVGMASTLSSTIIGLKLLPTTVLHHRHTGEVIISILLLQDLLAIGALLLIDTLAAGSMPWLQAGLEFAGLPLLFAGGLVAERWLLRPLFQRFDKVGEYVFLLSLGWCLGFAQFAQSLGLSYEVGAFIGGITLANSPIAPFIAESLRPLRDFFLVMFFFALGAGFDLAGAASVWPSALALATGVLVIKPVTYRALLRRYGESTVLAGEAGVRLGQMSEFSLLLVAVALQAQTISQQAAHLVQVATLITFVVSSTFVVLRYPSPIALSEHLRRD
ncbi:MAG TPA: sodium:proton antiporter [Gammaproteobacteria bacterium]|jgi:Kef-type K+ transport system membrane component KefB|nr:MAG: sodium:proton antiporter [Proteobacteria bacterium TMED154]PDH34393.1 MAG: sodium:proton antiporter [Candidatus Thioglobus sp. MED-G23]HAU40935.1 sodium:proton antiporter [Gammaproteobacteria bacterium]HBP83718.1 sodium:proton antiporter [Gammaproteobacteria bacterium]HCL73600.1 sodium:proton antiporter [Gammaproteobacteria bacterium]|tara:strand:+ start:520 stop:1686 length:1167 start_codon:yes stop_codon:yes gene_type:complete